MLTKAGLPGWFPEDFKTDPELHAAFDDAAEWHAHGRKARVHQHARTWDDLGALLEFSARTAALEVTPAPIGKPGGPGLYHIAGLGHSNYFDQVRNGLMKRGIPEGTAHAMTWGILRRWAAGGGKVHPEVRAAAVKALAEEKAKGALAHAHAVTWEDISGDIGLSSVTDFAAAQPASGGSTTSSSSSSGSPQARVPAGQAGGGQFGSGGGQATAGKPDAHQQHVAHVAHVAQVSTAKAALMATAADDRSKAAALIQQRNVLQKALASAGGKVSAGQSGAKTAATAKTKTTAPATASTATAAAPAASTTAKAPAAAKTATAAKAAATAAPGTAAAKATAAQLTQQIGALNTQINQLLAAAKQAAAQAAALK